MADWQTDLEAFKLAQEAAERDYRRKLRGDPLTSLLLELVEIHEANDEDALVQLLDLVDRTRRTLFGEAGADV